jgi:hypothetical protein
MIVFTCHSKEQECVRPSAVGRITQNAMLTVFEIQSHCQTLNVRLYPTQEQWTVGRVDVYISYDNTVPLLGFSHMHTAIRAARWNDL